MRSGEESEYLIQHRIARVGRGDVGGYSCHLITSYDSLASRPAALAVRSASRIIQQPQHQTVGEGATVQFSCEPFIDTSVNEIMRIVWYRNSLKLEEETDQVEFSQSGTVIRKMIIDLLIDID